MSWLSHFTNWVGEKSKVILPIVTGVAGFAAGMIPGVGGTVSKFIDKLGNKISGGVEILQGIGPAELQGGVPPASPQGAAVAAVEKPTNALTDTPIDAGATGLDSPRTKTPAAAGGGMSPGLLVALGLGGLLVFGGSGRRR